MKDNEGQEELHLDEAPSADLPAEVHTTAAHAEVDETYIEVTSTRRRRRNLIIISSAAAIILVIIAYLLLRPAKTTETTTETSAVVSVRVAKAGRQSIASEASALGTIFPREQAAVSPKINAQIKEMRVLKNQVVRAGQTIAVLESRDLQAQRAEAQAALREAQLNVRSVTGGANPQATAQAEKELRDARANVENARALYERRRALYQQGGIALKEVEAAQLALTQAEDQLRLAERSMALRVNAINPNERALAESRVTQAQDRLANLDAQLSYAVVRAPITGIVTDQFQFEGEFAQAGAKLVTISDISQVIAKAQFADTVVSNLKVGDEATVVPTDLPGEQLKGEVSLISRSSDPASRTVEVWVNLGNEAGRLRAGGAAQVVVDSNQTGDAIVVPASAVTLEASNADEGTVMVVDALSVARERKVKVGIRAGEMIQITEGLQENETVVTEGNYALPDGTKVEINEEKPEGEGDESEKPEAGEKP